MTFEEIAKKYFQTIWQASDKNEAVRAVQRKIDNLVYSESGEAISHEHKLKIKAKHIKRAKAFFNPCTSSPPLRKCYHIIINNYSITHFIFKKKFEFLEHFGK